MATLRALLDSGLATVKRVFELLGGAGEAGLEGLNDCGAVGVELTAGTASEHVLELGDGGVEVLDVLLYIGSEGIDL